MISSDLHIVPNTAEVAAKVMDGEAILINLTDGMYYSLDGSGGFLWNLVESRRTVAEIVDALHAQYDVTREQAHADVQAVLAQLAEARLVTTAHQPGDRTEPPAGSAMRLAYAAPRLQAYNDMAELLALDPPHPSLTDTLSKNLVE